MIKEGLTTLVRFPIFTLRGFDFYRNNHYVNAGKNQLLIYEKCCSCICCHDVCSQQLARLRQYTMGRFINHDGIADGMLNIDYNGGAGVLASWKGQLQNGPGLLGLMLVRMQSDWTATAPKMRKPWSKTDLDSQLSFFLAIEMS